MSIVTLPFFIFVAAVILVYYVLPLKYRWIVLLVGSYVFYWLNSAWLVFVLLGVSAITFLTGLCIQRVKDQNAALLKDKDLPREIRKERKEAVRRVSRRILTAGILLDLSALLFLKYFNFFGSNLNTLLHLFGLKEPLIPSLRLLLPLGLSFYTLQAISYMTDVYRGKIQADRHFPKFMLFMSFFPQILQGPIPRYSQLATQLYEGHRFNEKQLCFGAQLVLWGLFKKLVIAERVAIPVNHLFSNYSQYAGPVVFFAAVLYGLQIYADFSGGMDIARGIAQMMGIKLELNFNQPYFSTSIEDFWRRWHITMGAWMKDYIFYPLSLSRAFAALSRKSRKIFGIKFGKKLPAFLAMFIVYFCVGFWHGDNWKYIAYGIWNGMFIMSSILLEDVYIRAKRLCQIDEDTASWRFFQMFRTFVLVSFGRFFSRADRLSGAIGMFRQTFTNWMDITFLTNGSLLKMGLNNANWILLGLLAMLLLYVDYKHEQQVSFREVIAKQHLVFRWAIWILALFSIFIFGYYGPEYNAASFIYEQF